MLSLDQVRLLESRVAKALAVIDRLQAENGALRSTLSGYESRIRDLETLVRDYQQDQGRIEEGILNALERLNAFEDGLQADIQATERSSRVDDASTAEPVSDLGNPPSQDAVPPITRHASASRQGAERPSAERPGAGEPGAGVQAAEGPSASSLGMFSDEAGGGGTGVDDFDGPVEASADPAAPAVNELDIF